MRDRAPYEFARASVAVVLAIEHGVIAPVQAALGGVGTKPWRSREMEQTLQGKPANAEQFATGTTAALHEMRGRPARTVSRSNWPGAA